MAVTSFPEDSTFRDLHGRVRGALLRPGDGGYEEGHRLWNARFEKRPAMIARCTGTADVMAAVDFARTKDLPLAVKSTGHSYAGHSVCEGGLTLDLSPMSAVRVDPDAKTALVQPGATWGAFDHEAQAFGLATTGGTVSTVGVAGVTLGGGTGHLSRKFGLACDNLISADLVTAGGERVHASEAENADLFWALRGGGGNFGVITSLEFRLHEVGPVVLAGQVIHRFEDAGEVLRFYRDFMVTAADEIQCWAFVIHLPPLPEIPERLHGKPAIDLVVCYAGPIAEAEEALRPLREFGDPLVDGVEPQPYVLLQQAFDAGMPKGLRWYSRAHYFRELTDEAIETLVEHAEPLPGPFTMVYLEATGGAAGRVDRAETAFPHRDADFGIHIFGGWTEPGRDDEVAGWAREFAGALTPYATGGVYVNLLDRDENDRVPAAYGDNHGRLVDLKKEWDPGNLFRMNHNIRPEG